MAASAWKRPVLWLKRLIEGGQGAWECVAGSYGDAVNFRNILTYGQDEPSADTTTFDQPFSLVMAGMGAYVCVRARALWVSY